MLIALVIKSCKCHCYSIFRFNLSGIINLNFLICLLYCLNRGLTSFPHKLKVKVLWKNCIHFYVPLFYIYKCDRIKLDICLNLMHLAVTHCQEKFIICFVTIPLFLNTYKRTLREILWVWYNDLLHLFFINFTLNSSVTFGLCVYFSFYYAHVISINFKHNPNCQKYICMYSHILLWLILIKMYLPSVNTV